jgi:PAS domain S-box-containing protein
MDSTVDNQAGGAPRLSSDRFEAALAAAPIVVFNQDCELRYTWIGNPALGLTTEEALGRTDEELLGTEAARPLVEIKRRVLASGLGERREIHVVRNGQSGWFDLTVGPLRDLAGRISGVTCVAVDISARKQAEAALRESEAVKRQALESSPDAVFAIDREYRLLFNNRRHQRALIDSGGHPLEIGDNILLPAYPREWRERWRTAYDRALRGEELRLEWEWMPPDQRPQAIENSLTPLRDAGGTIVGVLVIGRDIAERKRLERERAAVLARLAEVEEQERHRLARELHDQTAQRLVALAVELKNLETHLAAGRDPVGRVRSLRQSVDDLQQQVRRIAWNLRAGEVVQGGLAVALRAYADEWSERVQVPVDCECRGLGGRRLPALLEGTLYRVAQEALANVERHAAARHVSVLVEREAAQVRLTVEDDGLGFDVDRVEQAPEAAQRLGLLGMKERVALAGGTLVLESAPGAGATILVRIPLAAGDDS